MRYIAALLFIGVCCGCKSADLEELGGDLPAPLVERYAEETEPYCDEGYWWIPGVMSELTRVWRTEQGFEARDVFGWGPIGLLFAITEEASYDGTGKLIDYVHSQGILWGYLVKYSFHSAVGEESRSEEFTFLRGLLGYRIDSKGAHTFYLLYAPIPFSSGS